MSDFWECVVCVVVIAGGSIGITNSVNHYGAGGIYALRDALVAHEAAHWESNPRTGKGTFVIHEVPKPE